MNSNSSKNMNSIEHDHQDYNKFKLMNLSNLVKEQGTQCRIITQSDTKTLKKAVYKPPDVQKLTVYTQTAEDVFRAYACELFFTELAAIAAEQEEQVNQ